MGKRRASHSRRWPSRSSGRLRIGALQGRRKLSAVCAPLAGVENHLGIPVLVRENKHKVARPCVRCGRRGRRSIHVMDESKSLRNSPVSLVRSDNRCLKVVRRQAMWPTVLPTGLINAGNQNMCVICGQNSFPPVDSHPWWAPIPIGVALRTWTPLPFPNASLTVS